MEAYSNADGRRNKKITLFGGKAQSMSHTNIGATKEIDDLKTSTIQNDNRGLAIFNMKHSISRPLEENLPNFGSALPLSPE